MQRIRVSHSYYELGGKCLDDDIEGIIVAPDSDDELRQVVYESMRADCNTWISKDGRAYTRFFNPYSGEFEFGKQSRTISMKDDELCITVGSGTSKRTMRLTRAIAMAWLEAPRTEYALQATAHEFVHAEYICWTRQGVRHVESCGTVQEHRGFPHETDEWKALRYEWKLRNDTWRTITPTTDVTLTTSSLKAMQSDEYWISKRGWLRTPLGHMTRGVRHCSQRLYWNISGENAIWMDEAVLFTWAPRTTKLCDRSYVAHHTNGDVGNNHFTNLTWITCDAPAICDYASDVKHCFSFSDFERRWGIRAATVWSRLNQLAIEGPQETLSFLVRLIPRRVLRLFDDLASSAQIRCSSSFRDVYDTVEPLLIDMAFWKTLDDSQRRAFVMLAKSLTFRAKLHGIRTFHAAPDDDEAKVIDMTPP